MADQPQGGLLGLDPDLVMQLGLGLMSAGRYGGNVGDSLAGAYQNYQQGQLRKQQLAIQKVQMQRAEQMFPYQMRALQGGAALLGGAPQGAPQGAPGAAPPGPQGLMGAPSGGPMPMGGVPPGAAPAPPSGASATPPQGMSDASRLVMGGAGMALAGMPGGAELQKAGEFQAANDPQQATRMAVAKDQITQDQALLQQAQANGAPPLMLKGLTNKLMSDMQMFKIASQSGTVTTMGGITPEQLGVSTISPREGTQYVGGVESPLPGALGTRAALARATAGGEAAYKPIQTLQGPGDADPGQASYTSVASLLGGGGGGGGAPTPGATRGAPGAAAPPGNVAALGPQSETFLKGRGTQAADYLTELNKGAENARDTNYSLDQMLQAAKGAQLGPGAPARAWGEKWLSGLAQAVGLPPSSELANYTELEKYSNKVGFATARAMGSREAAQIVSMAIQSNPNKSMVPEAFYGVANSMKAMNNYIMDKNVAMQAEGQNAQAAASKWIAQVDPRVWALTLSPEMGKQWAETVGKNKIQQAYQYMQPEERQALLRNIPADLRKQWLTKPTS